MVPTVREMVQGLHGDSRLTFLFVTGLVVAGAGVALSPLLVTGAVVGLLALWVACSEKRLKYALMAMALYMPFEEFILKWVPEGLFFYFRFGHFGLVAACFIVIVLRRLVEGRPLWIRTPIDTPLLLFLAISIISGVVNSVSLFGALISYQTFLRFIVLAFYLLFYIEFDRKDTVVLTKLLFVVVFIQCLIGIAQSVIGEPASKFLAPVGGQFGEFTVGRMTQPIYTSGYQIYATLGRYNVLAAFLGFFVVLSVPLYQQYRGLRPWFILLYVFAAPCLILTAARGPWLAIFVGAWVVFALEKQWKAFLLPLSAGLGLGWLLMSFSEQLVFIGTQDASALQRFLEVFTPLYLKVVTEYHGRLFFLLIFPVKLAQLGAGPFLLGFGPGMLGARAIGILGVNPLWQMLIPDHAAHLIVDVYWAYILGQAGIIALTCFVWMCLRLGWAVFTIHNSTDDAFLKRLSAGFIGVLTVQMVAACFAPTWEIRPLALYVWLYAGIILKLGYHHLRPTPSRSVAVPSTATSGGKG